MEKATFAGGCFWCTEAVFKRLKGVKAVLPGYCGGNIKNPSYEQVSSGKTGHAEAIQLEFNPDIISFKSLLEVFFYTHDPTTLNKQGNDKGTQYRSVVFYHSTKQKSEAEEFIAKLERDKIFALPIVTSIEPFKNYYLAEDYHKNYYDKNKEMPYCNLVIVPKINKLLDKFNKKVKEEYK